MYRTQCPLCDSQTSHYYEDNRRSYLQCEHCKLVFVPEKFHLNGEQEKQEYDKHQNTPEDAGYQHFLSRIVEPMKTRLKSGAQGLDFGCGPGPALAHMFKKAGFTVTNYDPIYFPDTTALNTQYDFICTTEVWEHLRKPKETLSQLWSCLKPKGQLGVMTKLVTNPEGFSRWHYKNDPTHILFFSRETLEFLASQWQADLEFVAKDAFIFKGNSRKNNS